MARFTQKIMGFPIKNADSYHLRSALAKKDGPPLSSREVRRALLSSCGTSTGTSFGVTVSTLPCFVLKGMVKRLI